MLDTQHAKLAWFLAFNPSCLLKVQVRVKQINIVHLIHHRAPLAQTSLNAQPPFRIQSSTGSQGRGRKDFAQEGCALQQNGRPQGHPSGCCQQ